MKLAGSVNYASLSNPLNSSLAEPFYPEHAIDSNLSTAWQSLKEDNPWLSVDIAQGKILIFYSVSYYKRDIYIRYRIITVLSTCLSNYWSL